MAYAETSVYRTIKNWTARYQVAQGGISAGKTVAILMMILLWCQQPENAGKLFSVVSRTYPHLRSGAMRDWRAILKTQNATAWFDVMETVSTWTYRPTGAVVEFFGADDENKVRGPRRDALYVNEANNISWEVFDQLAARTRDFIVIDYNPTSRFWAHNELAKLARGNLDFAIFTYRDNEALSASEREAIEAHERGTNWWRVYGEGQIGELENNIFKNWAAIDDLPAGAELERFGLDFGFEHPTALISVWRDAEGLIFREEIYASGLTPERIVAQVAAVDNIQGAPIICDGARPEIIAQMRMAGLRAVAANKDAGSVLRGIGEVQDLKNVRYIGRNIEREYLSYAWRQKADGAKIEEPVKLNDDALDAIRYAVDDLTAENTRAAAIKQQWADYDA